MASIFRDNVLTRTLSRFSLRIYLLTWNVNSKGPPDDMTNLLQLRESPLPDVYCIGLQEVYGPDWEEAISYNLYRSNFVRVKTRKMQGIHTFLFVQRPLLPYVSNIESELTRTGFGGYWGNKGAASVRLDFMGVNIIIVNSHLTAQKEYTVSRIEDIDSILDGQKFKDPDADCILDHDYIFWIGDLNFRIDDLTRSRVLQLIDERDYDALLKHDQLNMVKEEGLVFDDFQEGPIRFPPSYKFDVGTDVYDTSYKQRIPSYTDRIMYFYHNTEYGDEKLNADVLSYRSHPVYKASDHRPVSAVIVFTVPSRCIHGPVTFQNTQRKYHKETDNKFSYKIRKDFSTSSDNWIGLYRADFPHFDSYLKFQWVSHGKSVTQSDKYASVSFSASQTRGLEDGTYVLCYMTRKNSLLREHFDVRRNLTRERTESLVQVNT